MSDGWKKITRRFRRLLGAEGEVEGPKRPLSVSQIICPEDVIPQHGKPAPPSIARPARQPETTPEGVTITNTPWGVTHVSFHENQIRAPETRLESYAFDDDTVRVRDPVTRRLSRKKLLDGMNRTTGFYNPDGTLIDKSDVDW